MRRIAIAVVSAVIASLAACGDPVGPVPAVTLAPAVPALAANTTGKVAVCRESGKAGSGKFDEQYISASQLSAYFDGYGAPLPGHENDYRVTPRTSCPPPAAPGTFQLCSHNGSGVPAGAPATYLANGVPVTVGDGQCATLTYRVGTHVQVTRAIESGVQVANVYFFPFTVGIGDVAHSTGHIDVGTDAVSMHFLNTGIGTLKICTQTGAGVASGTPFTYFVDTKTLNTAAGTCTDLTGLPVGTVHLQQVVPLNVAITTLSGSGASGATIITGDAINGSADVAIEKGLTSTVIFVDAVANVPTSLVLCAAAGPTIGAGSTAAFSIRGNTYTLPVGPGSCTGFAGLPSNGVRVQAVASLTQVVTGIGFIAPPLFPLPSPASLISSDLLRGVAVVNLDPFGQTSTLTYTIDAR